MLRSFFRTLIDFAAECWALENATGAPRRHVSGLCDDEAARAGGQSRDDPFSNGPYGDWPFVPADLKIPVHGRRNDA